MKKPIIALLLLSLFLVNCKSTSDNYDDAFILKYPVILVHGIVAHDRWDTFSFWGRIPAELQRNGVLVFFGNTDAWGSYESNAELLKATVDNVLLETNSEKVNIIAHSKGGIDSRYFIWKYGYGDKVASLTTISTPHRGAEIAEVLWEQQIIHTNAARNALHVFGRLYGDNNPNLYKIIYDLSCSNMERFNEEVILDERVYFHSIYSVMNNSCNEPLFSNSYRFIMRERGANDGVVSEYSSRWGENITRIERLSHIEIIDIKKRNIAGINVLDIYTGIIRDLAERGF